MPVAMNLGEVLQLPCSYICITGIYASVQYDVTVAVYYRSFVLDVATCVQRCSMQVLGGASLCGCFCPIYFHLFHALSQTTAVDPKSDIVLDLVYMCDLLKLVSEKIATM